MFKQTFDMNLIPAKRAFDINPMPSKRYKDRVRSIMAKRDKNILSAITAKRAFDKYIQCRQGGHSEE